MITVSVKDLKYSIILFLLTFPHINPGYLSQLKLIGTVIDAMRLISFVVIICVCFFAKRRMSVVAFLIVAIECYLVLITVAKAGDIRKCVVDASSVIAVVLLYDCWMDQWENFLSVQLFCFEVVIYINLVTEILFPKGLYNSLIYTRNFFLGYYNTHIKVFIPALLIGYLYMIQKNNHIRFIFLVIGIYLNALLVWSGGTILSLAIMFGVYCLFRNYTGVFNYFTYSLVQPLFYLLIIKLRLLNYTKWLVGGILGKWNSLVGRMIVWEIAIQKCRKSIITGYGIQPSAKIIKDFVWAAHAHNQMLDILYSGGLIYLLSIVALIILVGSKVYRYKEKKSAQVISIAFLGWWINTLVEPYTTPFLMAMFVVACKWMENETYEQPAWEK